MVDNRQSDAEIDDADPFSGDPGGPVAVVTVTGENGERIAGFVPESWGRMPADTRDSLVALQRLALERRELRDVLDNLALDAREGGASWAALAWCTGITAEGARQRWKDMERPALPEWIDHEPGTKP